MPSGVLWVAYQLLKTEMEYCVRVETRLYLYKYKNPLKIVWSDMRKIREFMFACSCCQDAFGQKMSVRVNAVAGGEILYLGQRKGRKEEHGRSPAVSLLVRVVLRSLVFQK